MSVVHTREEAPRIVRSTGPARPASAPSAGFTGRDFLHILRRRWLMIVILLMLCTGASVAATFIWLRTAPIYMAWGLLKVNPREVSAMQNLPLQPTRDTMQRLMMTEASLIKTDTVLNLAARDEDMRQTPWFRRHQSDLLRRLDEDIRVAPHGNSDLLRISMSGTDRDSLADVVNAVLMAAANQSHSMSSSARQEEMARLNAERNRLQTDLRTIRTRVDETRRNIDVANYRTPNNPLAVELAIYIQAEAHARQERDELRDQLALLESQAQAGQLRYHPAILPFLNYDPALNALRHRETQFAVELDQMRKDYGPDHRTISRVESRVEAMREQIARMEERIVRNQAEGLLQAARQELNTAVERLAQATQGRERVNRQLRGIQAALEQLEDDEKRADEIVLVTQRIDDQIRDLRLLAEGDLPLTVAQRAVRPLQPSVPKWQIMIPLGLFLGLVLGLGMALLLEFIDTSIRRPSDIGRRVNLPLLGIVPHLDDIEDDIEEIRTAALTAPQSMVGEAFRQIRTNLLFSGPVGSRRSLLVSSPSPEDGRTTVAVNLAATIAQGGRRVLLVDANFRQPMIQELFPDTPEGGLSTALVGQGQWQELVASVMPNLDVLGAGPLPPSPADLLGSEQMEQLVQEMVNTYDQVIIDGAPWTVVTDSSVLASRVDGVILAVRAGANTDGIVKRTRESLDRLGAHIVGAVLNGVRTTAGGYLRKNYETFYDYHERPQLPSPKR